MLTWIPIIGPIIGGIVDIFKQKTNTDLARQVDTNKTSTEKLKSNNLADIAIIQARAEVAKEFKDDWGSKITRDIIMFPVGLWVFLTLWDSTFRNLIPDYTFRTLALPSNMEYIPYAVIAFLFVTAWRR